MSQLTEQPSSRRSSVRRQVRLDAAVLSSVWDAEVPLLATDLSEEGLWVQSQLPLEAGSQLRVRFRPPRWAGDEPLTALASVVRVGLFRRRPDIASSGMGLRFVDLEEAHRARLRACLRGLPPPLPGRTASSPPPLRLRPDLPDALSHDVEEIELTDDDIIFMDGDQEFTWRAEGALLTGGRPVITRATVSHPAARAVQLVPRRPKRRRRYVERSKRRGVAPRPLVRPLLRAV